MYKNYNAFSNWLHLLIVRNQGDSQGYEYSFVEAPHDRYICIICHLPSRDPQMTGECCQGQILCKPCLERARQEIASSVDNSCLICRTSSTQGFITHPNFQLDREIRNLRIYCINKEKGCEWQGELNNINDHLKLANSGCQFQEVECSNNCGELIERRHLATHTVTMCARRKVNCQYCRNHVTIHYQVVERILHTQVCPKVPLPCPNKCGVKDIPREDMKKHEKECLFEVCANQCGIALERRKLSDHIKTECPRRKVNCQYCNYVGEYQLIEGRHKDKCPKFPLSCPNKCGVGTIARDSMEKHKGECQLEVINCYNNCGRKLERRYLNNHVKNECPRHKASCPHCHLTGEHQFVMGNHTELCPKFPLLCPNKCEIGTIPREDLKAHKDECPLEVIECKYCTVGCDIRFARKDQEKHMKEKIDDHLMMATCKLHKIDDIQRELTDTKGELANLRDTV